MIGNVAVAATLVFGTVLIHTICTVGILVWLRGVGPAHWCLRNAVTRASVLGCLVFGMSLIAGLEAIVWAGFYVWEGALGSMNDAIYFSLVTFTTLGYGDVTLKEPWRVFGAFQAANGIIMFGWTTAIIVAVGQRVFFENTQTADPTTE